MKATTTIKTTNNVTVTTYNFNTIKEAMAMAQHQFNFPFCSPLTEDLERLDIYVNVNKTGKNVFYKFKVK
jgi:hypothetical protein